ncbi:MAG: hypothetical protein K8E24_013210 [Methanobacterium paludis]|nr:hypothetical protein [Methanobacterium paludis]
MSKEYTIQDFVDKIKKQIEDDPESFKNRLEVMKECIFDYELDPWKFNIMADAYMSFFDIPDDVQEKWLVSSFEPKTEIVVRGKWDVIKDFQLMAYQVIRFVKILQFSGGVYRDPFYKYVAARLLYVFSGEEVFLTDMGLAPYLIPKNIDGEDEENEAPQKETVNDEDVSLRGMFG